MKTRFLIGLMISLPAARMSWAQGYARTAAVAAKASAVAGAPAAAAPALLEGISLPVAHEASVLPGLTPAVPSLPGVAIEALPESFVIGVSNAAELRFAPAGNAIPKAVRDGALPGIEFAAPATPAEAATPRTVLGSVRKLAQAMAPDAAGEAKSESELQAVSHRFFDQNLASPADNDVDASPSVESAAGPGPQAQGSASVAEHPGTAAASHLGKLYPRVVFIQDVFKGPASKSTVASIEKLLNEGVRVVFMTWRPAKGPGLPGHGRARSAEEVLLKQLKFRSANPIVVVSHNGARVSMHGRARNPKPVIADAGGFRPEHIASFRGIVGKVEAKMGLSQGAIGQSQVGTEDAAYSYVLELPASVSDVDAPARLAEMIRSYNRYLKASHFPYAMTAHPDDPRAAVAHAMPLRFGIPRVFEALKARYPEDRVAESASKFLILADSRKSPKLATSFPNESEIQAVDSDGALAETLGAVLGERNLPTASVNLAKLRQFVEYWEPVHRLALSDQPSRSGSGGMRSASVDQKLAMYTGTVLYQLMAYIYDQMWQGQHNSVRLSVLQAKLRSMWYLPFKNGVNVNKGIAQAMKTQAWKARQRGYLEKANAYLTNFYLREFGDYATGSRSVQENLVGLSSFRSSLVSLEFVSASTGKLYKIHTRIPRVMKSDTATGRVLTAYSYRTGKESPDDGERLLAQTLAMALLKGYGRVGDDGKWRHGAADGPVLSEVRVQLEYMTSHRTVTFKPEQLLKIVPGSESAEFDLIQGPVAKTITSAIERMEADPEYQKYYEEHEEKASAKDASKKKAKASPKKTAKKPAKKESGRKA